DALFGGIEARRVRGDRLAAGLARADPKKTSGDALQVRREVLAAHVHEPKGDDARIAEHRGRGPARPAGGLGWIDERGRAELDRGLRLQAVDRGRRRGA